MKFPSIKTLAKTAIYVGIAGISSVMYMRSRIEDNIRNTDYYKLAFSSLRQHKGAIGILGEPIKDMGFDVGDPQNNCDGKNSHFEVSVKGAKERGKIFFWATKDDEKGWLLDRLELELKSQPDRRYLLKKATSENLSFSQQQ